MGMKIVRECVCCPPDMGCNKAICRNWNRKVYFCDKCKEEYSPEDLFVYETKSADYDYCVECFIEETLKYATRTSEVIGND